MELLCRQNKFHEPIVSLSRRVFHNTIIPTSTRFLIFIICSCVIERDEVDKEVGMDVDQESGQEVQVVRIENELCQSDLELTDQTNVGQLQVTSSAQKIPGFGDNSRDSI